MKKNVILYCRVSSDEQTQNTSLKVQEDRLREYCERNQYNIVECYREDYSAKTFTKRPEMRKIMAYCRATPKRVDEILFLRWDRYSRSLEYALTNIRQLKKLDITVNSIENPLDPESPDFPTMLGVYIGSAEAENNKISKRTKDGIIKNLELGKCTNKAPRGYKNVSYISEVDNSVVKYVVIVEKDADYIRQIFKEVAKGVETPNYIRKQFERKGFKVPKSSFPDMLRNPFYMGYVKVPAYDNKPERLQKGVHEAIIEEEVFNKVQDILNPKKKSTPKLSKKIHPDLFLGKYLLCPTCGESMTGGGSKGNGGVYHYYHCSPNPKHFRCRADEANELFAQYTANLKPNETVLKLYSEILNDVRLERNGVIKQDLNKFEAELKAIEVSMNKADDKLINDDIDKSTHTRLMDRYRKESQEIQMKIDLMKNPNRSNLEPKLKYSIALINNIDSYMRDARVEVKCKVLSSMFPQKITFDGKSYRTNSYNSVLDLIYKETNKLQGDKKKVGTSFNTNSDPVPRADTLPRKKQKTKEYNYLTNNTLILSFIPHFIPFLPYFCHLVHF